MKKFLAILLAAMMLLATAGVAFAENVKTYTVTINPTAGTATHTYEAYQIFKGSLNETTGELGNLEWGDSVNTADESFPYKAPMTAADVAGTLTKENAAEFAEQISDFLTGAAIASDNAAPYELAVPAGYYLIKDMDESLEGTDTNYTKYLLNVSASTTVTAKDEKTTFQKKVKDTNDTTGAVSEWQDSADYDLGDSVPFQLKATLPQDYEAYEEYYIEFEDHLSMGLTYTVPVDGKIVAKVTDKDGQPQDVEFTVTAETVVLKPADEENEAVTETKIKFVCEDLTAANVAVNKSTVTIEYNATLNEDAILGNEGNPNTAKLIFSNNPNGDGKGQTANDTVIVFTYKVVINKTNGSGAPLTGAEFVLEKKDTAGNWIKVHDGDYMEKDSAGTTFTATHLDDGDYRIREVVTPAGFNTIKNIEFTVTAEHKVEWTSGVNTDAFTSLSGEEATGEVAFTAAESEGSLTTQIINLNGATLPSTGGIGTTLFYVIGALMMTGAAVLMITKKRMSV